MFSAAHMVTCLICKRTMRALGAHLSRTHGISGREYKAMFDLPATYPLAADDLREAQSRLIRQLDDAGMLNRDPALASEAARSTDRGYRTSDDRYRQAELARSIPHKQIGSGGKRADGRDADRARAYQREYRARGKTK